MDLQQLNRMSDEQFVATLDGIWEHSPWIAKSAAKVRPFGSREKLASAMWRAVTEANEEAKLSLLCAHPDLAGKLARAGELTEDSKNEQASLGLDRLSDEEFEAFTTMNRTYRERFEFPFIICVRNHTRASIRKAFEERLSHSREQELQIALDEVRKIAEYRLNDRITL